MNYLKRSVVMIHYRKYKNNNKKNKKKLQIKNRRKLQIKFFYKKIKMIK